MSMHLSVYVGPYLKCFPLGRHMELDRGVGDRLYELQGESSFDAGCDILGPNIDMPLISRPLLWEKDGDSETVIDIPDSEFEMNCFADQFADDILALRRFYERVELSWGIVPGWR